MAAKKVIAEGVVLYLSGGRKMGAGTEVTEADVNGGKEALKRLEERGKIVDADKAKADAKPAKVAAEKADDKGGAAEK